MAVVATGTVSDYTPTVQAEIRAKIAAEVGVAAAAVALRVEAASVRLSFTITLASQAAATSAASTLGGKLDSTASASELLSTPLLAVAVASVEGAPTVVVPASDASRPPSEEGGGAALALGVAGGVLGGVGVVAFGYLLWVKRRYTSAKVSYPEQGTA